MGIPYLLCSNPSKKYCYVSTGDMLSHQVVRQPSGIYGKTILLIRSDTKILSFSRCSSFSVEVCISFWRLKNVSDS